MSWYFRYPLGLVFGVTAWGLIVASRQYPLADEMFSWKAGDVLTAIAFTCVWFMALIINTTETNT